MTCICSHRYDEHYAVGVGTQPCGVCPCRGFKERTKHSFKVNRKKTAKDGQYIHFKCDCGAKDKIWRNTWRLIVSNSLKVSDFRPHNG